MEGSAGLMLFPNEVKLFKKKHVRPCLAMGKSLTHGSFKVITYQLTEKVCPHFEDNSCGIYRERPLSYRGFPFVFPRHFMQADFETDPTCTFMKELKEERGVIHNFADCESIDARRLCQRKIGDYLMRRNRKNRSWVFDLKTGKWERYPGDRTS